MIKPMTDPYSTKAFFHTLVSAEKKGQAASRKARKPIGLVFLVPILVLLLAMMMPLTTDHSRAAADGYTWVDTKGPGNGSAYDLAFAPERDELYRGTNRGVWRYDVNTGSWSDTGGAVSSFDVYSLLWEGSFLYAAVEGRGIWRYDPTSGTWNDKTGGQQALYSVDCLAWDGSNLYAGIYRKGVWRLDPLTDTWSDISDVLSGAMIEAIAWCGSELYVGTTYKGVWRYDPILGTWADTGGGMDQFSVISLAWGGSVLYAGTGGKSVWRYDPAEGTWADVGSELSNYSFRSLAWDGSSLYAGAAYSSIIATGDFGVWCYDPVADTWTETGGISKYTIQSLALDGKDLYAGTSGQGVWYYEHVGKSWTDTGGGISDYDIKSLLGAGSFLYAGTSGNGLWRYDPCAEAWSDIGTGFSKSEVRSLAWDGSKLYAVAGLGIWRYDPVTGSVEDIKGGLLGTVYSVACGGSGVYASTSIDVYLGVFYCINGVYRYDPASGGWNLILVQTSYKIPNPYRLAWGGTNLYACASGFGVWRYDPMTGIWVDTGGGMNIYSISCMEWDGFSLYAGTYSNGVWRYSPLAGTWSNTGGGLSGNTVHSLVWDGSSLLAHAGGTGIWRFNPWINTWTSLGGRRSAFDDFPIAWDGANIYAGSHYQGVWRFSYSGTPVISSLSPAAGAAGTEVVIRGSAFGDSRGDSYVSFGSAQATEYISWSDICIKCRVPAMEPGMVRVRVNTSSGASNEMDYTVTTGGVTILKIDPNSAVEGNNNVLVVIEGSEFQAGAEVRLEQAGSGTVIEAFDETISSSSRITCRLDLAGAKLGEYDVVVKNPDGFEARLQGGFRVTNICGVGAAAAVIALAFTMGLLYLAGSGVFVRKVRYRFSR